MKMNKKKRIKFTSLTSKILITSLVLIVLVFPFLGFSSYIVRIAVMVMVYCMLALGLNILTGCTGQVSLGNAGFYAIGAYCAGILATKFNAGFMVCLIVAMIVTALSGLIIGIPTLRLKGSYLSIVTLGFGEIVRLIILNWESLTNGPLGVRNIPKPSFFGLTLTLNNGGMYFQAVILLSLIALVCYLVMNSKYGRTFNAIKEDELAANMMGINCAFYKTLAFVLSATISGIAGCFYAYVITYIEPNMFNFDTSIMILSIVILGGMGSIRGMLLGSLILVSFPEVFRFLNEYRFVIYGISLVVLMRYRPQGILGGRSSKPYPLPKALRERVDSLNSDVGTYE